MRREPIICRGRYMFPGGWLDAVMSDVITSRLEWVCFLVDGAWGKPMMISVD